MGVEGGKFPLNAINQAKRGLAVDGAPATDVKLKVFSARDTASLQDGQTRKTAGQRHAQIGRRRLDKPLGRNGRKGRNDTLFLLLSISDDYGFLQGIHLFLQDNIYPGPAFETDLDSLITQHGKHQRRVTGRDIERILPVAIRHGSVLGILHLDNCSLEGLVLSIAYRSDDFHGRVLGGTRHAPKP